MRRMAGGLVGRLEELSLLGAAHLGGDLAGVVISGEAGVGKTSLARAFVGHPREDGTSEWLAATSSLAHIPFGVFAHLLSPSEPITDPLGAFHAVSEHLRHRGDRVVVGVDDAHLLDEGSAALVHHLAVGGEAFLVVTVRSDARAPDAIRALWKDGLAQRVDLQALSVIEAGALLGDALGGSVERATVHRLWDVTRGNPLFLCELVGVCRASGALVRENDLWALRGPLGVGGRLSEILRDRFLGVSAGERAALELIAAGEPIDVSSLTALVPIDVLSALEQRMLVEIETSGARRSIRLAHPLYGEELRAEIGRLHTAELRQRLADGIEARGARRTGDLLRIAMWRLESGDALDGPSLLVAARQAAEFRDRELTERLARASVTHGGGVVAKVELGDALYWQHRFDEARAILDSCLEDGPSDEERVQVAVRLANTHFFGFDDAEAADDVLATAIAAIPPGSSKDEAIGARATLAVYAGRTAEALELVQPVLASDRTPERARARALHAAVFAHAVAGRGVSATRQATDALPLAMSISQDIPTAAGGIVIGTYIANWMAGDFTGSAPLIEHLYEESLPAAVDEFRGTWAHFAGHGRLVRGHARTAIELLAEGARALAGQDPGRLRPWALASLARAFALIGDIPSAESALDESRATEPRAIRIYAAEIRLAAAWVASVRGEHSAARSIALEAADLANAMGQRATELVMLHEAVRLGSDDSIDRLVDVAGEVEGPFAAAAVVHATARATDDATASAHAAQGFEEMGADLLAAEAWAGAARLASHQGLSARRFEALTRARACVERCEGARTMALEGLEGPSELDRLTRREREVGALAARGLSSPEIATRLVVSVRTVDNHLAHVFAKLGVSSRADLGPLLAPLHQSDAENE